MMKTKLPKFDSKMHHSSPDELPKSQFNTEIWFEGAKIPPEVQSCVARLHCNLGHAPKAEIIGILAAAGGLSCGIINGLETLRCGSCIRLGKPLKPPTSSTMTIKHAGFFGDPLQADIIYVRILTGQAMAVFDVCCINTNFHAAAVVPDRYPKTILKTLKEIWYCPFGPPLSLTPDSDRAYLGECQEWLGIECKVIPTEEAWRLGNWSSQCLVANFGRAFDRPTWCCHRRCFE